MSKMMEALKASSRVAAKPESVSKAAAAKKADREMTQEQLAQVYFGGSASALAGQKGPNQPVVIRVVEKPGWAGAIPWIITSIAFLITAFSLFSTKRVFVDIRVVDDKAQYADRFVDPSRLDAALAAAEASSRPTATITEGDRVPMDRVFFDGAARLKSSSQGSALTLVNSSVSHFARVSITPANPIDMTGSKLVFYVKGARGGENLAVAIKDRNNIQAFERGKVFPFPEGLSTGWARAEIPLTMAVNGFDRRNVTSLRFDFGSNVHNQPGDTIYLRDLQVVA